MNKYVLTSLCMYPFDEDTSLIVKLASILFTYTTFFFNLSAVIGAVAFIHKFITSDLERCLYALLHIVAHSAIVYIQIAASLLRYKIADIFTELANIYDASK